MMRVWKALGIVLAVVALWAMNEPWEEHTGAPEPCVPEWTHYGQACQ